jgi:hypothetical protein
VLDGCVSVRPLGLVPPDRVAQTSLVLDADGRTVAALHGPEDRTAVPLSEVSRWMRLAVVDTEDARFWRHGGVDWLAVARVAARDLERGKLVEGGSTITQQYVKNTYVSGERTLRRKLAEAAHAWGLERGNTKLAILEAYLNTVYFGQGAYGVEAAAQSYFSTRADRLILTQAALLAGLIQAPAAYDPFRHPRGGPEPPGPGPGPHGAPRPPGPAGGRPGPGRGRVGGPGPAGADPVVRGVGARPAARPGGPPLRRPRDLEAGPDRPGVHRRVADRHHRRPGRPEGRRAGGGGGRGTPERRPVRRPGGGGAGHRGGQGAGRRARLVGRRPVRPGQPGHRGR